MRLLLSALKLVGRDDDFLSLRAASNAKFAAAVIWPR
jgi:hypothetical protein